MPELPEIETLARELKGKLVGLVLSKVLIRRRSVLKTPPGEFRAGVAGRKIISVARRAKFLGVEFEDHTRLWFHLGMTGQLLWRPEPGPAERHTHLIFEFKGTAARLLFRDIRRFGGVLFEKKPLRVFERFGPDPFEMDGADFFRIFKGRKATIKSLLLNQALVSGLGNIYASESLFRAGIRPLRRALRITRSQFETLHEAVCLTLRESIREGGSSIDDYVRSDSSRGEFQRFHKVYGRAGEPCRKCASTIRQVRIGGRSSFFCPRCQA